MYFTNCNTAEQMKAEHTRLVKEMHPDRGGNTSHFQAMQAEYEKKLQSMIFERKKANNRDAEFHDLSILFVQFLKTYKNDIYMLVKNAQRSPLAESLLPLAPKKIQDVISLFKQ